MLSNLTLQETHNLKNARLLYYDFFYGLFVFELLDGRVELVKKQLDILKNAPLDDASEASIGLLRQELEENGIKNIKEEFSRLFALPFGEKQVGMHLSHYYENCIGAESLLKMRSLLKKSDVRVETSEFKESEEHLGFLFGFMRYLVENEDTELSKEVFLFIKGAYIGLIGEIRERQDAKYYLALVNILEGFMSFENDVYV